MDTAEDMSRCRADNLRQRAVQRRRRWRSRWPDLPARQRHHLHPLYHLCRASFRKCHPSPRLANRHTAPVD